MQRREVSGIVKLYEKIKLLLNLSGLVSCKTAFSTSASPAIQSFRLG